MSDSVRANYIYTYSFLPGGRETLVSKDIYVTHNTVTKGITIGYRNGYQRTGSIEAIYTPNGEAFHEDMGLHFFPAKGQIPVRITGTPDHVIWLLETALSMVKEAIDEGRKDKSSAM